MEVIISHSRTDLLVSLLKTECQCSSDLAHNAFLLLKNEKKLFYDELKHKFKLEENCGIDGQSPAACICVTSTLQQAKTTVADPPCQPSIPHY